jgi:LysM repeat protein
MKISCLPLKSARIGTALSFCSIVLLPTLQSHASELQQPSQKYVVQPGDSLWKISETTLNDPARWTQLFQKNSAIIRDPNKIYPGQELFVGEAVATSPESVATANPTEGVEASPTKPVTEELPFQDQEQLTKLKVSRVDLDAGLAVLKLFNDDISQSNIHLGAALGISALFLGSWGMRAFARSSLVEINMPLNFQPTWLNAMAQYKFFNKNLSPDIEMSAAAVLGLELYRNLSPDTAQRFVKTYSGPTAGISLNFDFGHSKIYSTGGDVIYTHFASGNKFFIHGNVYRRFPGTRWSLGAGYWADILNTSVGFSEKLVSLETHLRYTF